MKLLIKSQRGKRGSLLLLALFFMVILGFMALAMIKLMPVELNSATRANRDLSGFYAASAGVEATLARLRKDYSLSLTSPSSFVLAGPVGTSWTFSATATRLGGTLATYKVVSDGIPTGTMKASRRVTCYIQDKPISDFNLFTEGTLRWNTRNQVEGPAHGGQKLEFAVNADRYLDPKTTFGSVVTTSSAQSNNNIKWTGPGPAPSTNPQWQQINKSGLAGIVYGYSDLHVPTADFATAAFGGTNPPSLSNGLYVPTSGAVTSGGLYIKGEVDDLTLRVVGGNQVMDFAMKSQMDGPVPGVSIPHAGQKTGLNVGDGGTWSVFFVENATSIPGLGNVASGQTVVRRPDGSFVVYQGLTNGVVHVAGQIGTSSGGSSVTGGLSGVNKGGRSITASGEIFIDGRVTRDDLEGFRNPASSDPNLQDPHSANPPFKPPTSNDNLTVVANDGFRVDAGDVPANADGSKTANLYGLFVTQREFRVDGARDNTQGRINVVGSVAQVNTLCDAQWVDADANGKDIWDLNFLYDPQLSFKPNSYLPGLGQFGVKAFSETPLP